MKSVVFLSVISLLMFASCSNEDNVDPVESETVQLLLNCQQ